MNSFVDPLRHGGRCILTLRQNSAREAPRLRLAHLAGKEQPPTQALRESKKTRVGGWGKGTDVQKVGPDHVS